jgi:hypothetical protein
MRKGISFVFFMLCFFITSTCFAWSTWSGCSGGTVEILSVPVLTGISEYVPPSSEGPVGPLCSQKAVNINDEYSVKYASIFAVSTNFGAVISKPSNCTVLVVTACGTQETLNTLPNVELSNTVTQNIPGVPVGDEKSVVEDAMTIFKSEHICPDKSVEGLGLTDSLSGSSYSSYVDSDMGDATLAVDLWRRCGYTRLGGNVVPLENISGGGGNGNVISADDMAWAVGQGTGPLLGSSQFNGQPLNSIDNTLSGMYSYLQDHPMSLSVGDVADGVEQGLNNWADSGNVYQPDDGSNRDEYILNDQGKTFESVWNDFVSSMQSSPIGDLRTSFFSGVPSPGSVSAPTFTINGGTTFGTHSFSMSSLSDYFNYIRPVVILCFAFISVRLVVVKGA